MSLDFTSLLWFKRNHSLNGLTYLNDSITPKINKTYPISVKSTLKNHKLKLKLMLISKDFSSESFTIEPAQVCLKMNAVTEGDKLKNSFIKRIRGSPLTLFRNVGLQFPTCKQTSTQGTSLVP